MLTSSHLSSVDNLDEACSSLSVELNPPICDRESFRRCRWVSRVAYRCYVSRRIVSYRCNFRPGFDQGLKCLFVDEGKVVHPLFMSIAASAEDVEQIDEDVHDVNVDRQSGTNVVRFAAVDNLLNQRGIIDLDSILGNGAYAAPFFHLGINT